MPAEPHGQRERTPVPGPPEKYQKRFELGVSPLEYITILRQRLGLTRKDVADLLAKKHDYGRTYANAMLSPTNEAAAAALARERAIIILDKLTTQQK